MRTLRYGVLVLLSMFALGCVDFGGNGTQRLPALQTTQGQAEDIQNDVPIPTEWVAVVIRNAIEIQGIDGTVVRTISISNPKEVQWSTAQGVVIWTGMQEERTVLYAHEVATNTTTSVYWSRAPISNVQLSPRFALVSFFEEGALYSMPLATGAPFRIAENAVQAVWSPEQLALVVTRPESTSYVQCDAEGRPRGEQVLLDKQLLAPAFLDDTTLFGVAKDLLRAVTIDLRLIRVTEGAEWGMDEPTHAMPTSNEHQLYILDSAALFLYDTATAEISTIGTGLRVLGRTSETRVLVQNETTGEYSFLDAVDPATPVHFQQL